MKGYFLVKVFNNLHVSQYRVYVAVDIEHPQQYNQIVMGPCYWAAQSFACG